MKAEETVSFEEAVQQSLEAQNELRVTMQRKLRHYTNRILRIKGVAERAMRAMGVKKCSVLPAAAFEKSTSSYPKGRTILYFIFAYSIRQVCFNRSPLDDVEAPRLNEKPIEPLSLDEVLQLERAAESA